MIIRWSMPVICNGSHKVGRRTRMTRRRRRKREKKKEEATMMRRRKREDEEDEEGQMHRGNLFGSLIESPCSHNTRTA